jgi:hypothetical protein
MAQRSEGHDFLGFIRVIRTFTPICVKKSSDFQKTKLMENIPLTVRWQRHRIAPNMLKSVRWFAFYFYYGTRTPAAVGGA